MMTISKFRNAKTGEETVVEYDDGEPEPTQAEIDAQQDAAATAMAAQVSKQGTLIHALAQEVFELAKAADDTLTKTQFKDRIKARIKAGLK